MPAVSSPEPATGSQAADFRLPDTEGRLLGRDDVRGERGLLVMFICNHCPYVKAIRERLLDDCRELMALGIGVVAINANDADAYPDDSPQRMREVVIEYGFPFAYLVDRDQTAARDYGAVCTPDFFGFNANLELQYRGRLDAAARGPRGPDDARELVDAMRAIAATGEGPELQVPSIGCSIKWR